LTELHNIWREEALDNLHRKSTYVSILSYWSY